MQTPNLSTPKYIHIITGILLLCTHAFTLRAGVSGDKDSLITIPFGHNDHILYSLQRGTYDVFFNGKQVVTAAYAAYGGAKPEKSTQPGKRRYSVQLLKDKQGKGKLHIMEQAGDGVRVQQLFYAYAGSPFFFVQVRVLGKGVGSSYMSPFITDNLCMEAGGDRRALAVPFDNDMWARYDAQPLDKANFTSSEVTAFYNNDTYRGLIIGSIEHTTWKSGIKVSYAGNNTLSVAAFGGLSDSVITHDKIPHGKVSINDTLCSSPTIMIGLFSDWRTGMEQYAMANRLAEPRVITAWNKATPLGWNSWGAIQTKLDLHKAKAVVDFFSDSCKGFRNEDGTLYIDLDSFWDNLVKGGMDGDVSQLTTFVEYCRSKHVKPGIYWAPFADWGKYDRRIEGSSYRYPAGWITQHGIPVEVDGARALDPTYPGTKERILHYINRFKALGFEMIKVDFLGHGAMENDHFYNPAVTTGMQAYKEGMEFLDSVLADKMLVYAAISPTMATGRYVHMRRIACDAFSAIDNTEYTLNSTGYGWWQHRLYDFMDADHVVFNREKEGANRARLASALVTGTLVTGDDFSEAGPWRKAAQQLLQNKALLTLIKDGHPFRPIDANTGKSAVELFVKTMNGQTYIAAFNYGNAPHTYGLPAARIGFKKGATITLKELFSQASSTMTGTLQLNVAAGDAAIYQVAVQDH